MNIFNRFMKTKNEQNVDKITLILAEKREMAANIAAALINSSRTADGYIEGSQYIITWTNGHIFTLKDPEDYDLIYKQWKMELLPIVPDKFELRLRRDPKKANQYRIIKTLIGRDDVEKIVLATDSGREGQLLGRYVLDQLKNKKPVYRFWSSSLTKNAIIEAFNNLKPDSEYDGIYECARARAELDYLIGINFSRAYSLYNKFPISVGRCLTAMLALICKRDEEIELFKADYYSEVAAHFSPGYIGKYINNDSTRITKEYALQIKNEIDGKKGEIQDISGQIIKQEHPLLFNLTEIQRTLNRKYGYTPQQTVDTLEDLYLIHKIVSYPRTPSMFITDNEAKELINIFKSLKFGKFEQYANYCLSVKKLPLDRVVNNELVSDHPALIPLDSETSLKYNSLNEREKNVFDEVVFRFLSVFYDDYEYESIKIVTQIINYNFITKTQRIINLGWRAVYEEDYEPEEDNLKTSLKIGQCVGVNDVTILDKRTKPADHYTDDTLLDIMSNPKRLIKEENLKQALKGRGIGTEATRATLIETLIEKKYVKREQKRLIATELGRRIIKCIDIDLLKSVDLTADIEFNLEKIARNEVIKDEFMKEATKFVINGVKYIKNKEPIPAAENTTKILGKCPKCKKGNIIKNNGGYGCTEFQGGCRFYVSEIISGTYIDEAEVKKLIKNGRTDMLMFLGKDNKFRARLVYNDLKKKTEFQYI